MLRARFAHLRCAPLLSVRPSSVPPAAGNQTEVDALLMFRSALASSAALEDWSGRLPSACGWTGVVCGPSGHVTQLVRFAGRLLCVLCMLRSMRSLACVPSVVCVEQWCCWSSPL